MIKAYPRLSEAQEALDAQRYHQAAELALTHVRAHPEDPRGLGLLGSVAMKMGALSQGEQFLRQALRRAPTDIRILRELASCLHQQERLGESLDLYRRIEASQPNDVQIKMFIGSILDKLGRNDDAMAVFEQLIALKPDHPPTWVSYGHTLRFAGRTDDAVKAYRRATEIDDEYGEAWWGMANIKSKILTDEDMAVLEKSLSIAIDPRNTAPLNFSIARGWHDRKEYERAFNHYSEGNRIRAESIGYQSNELTDEVAEYVRLIDPGFFNTAAADQVAGPVPIFIVSLPRSGSTLLEQMLGSHPDVAAAGELPYVPALLRTVMEQHTRRGSVTVPQVIKLLDDDEAISLGREYLRRAAYHHAEGAEAFVDKLPHNWSNILFIHRILPQAKFIDIRRSAMDCCFSNFTQSFSRAHAASFALKDIGQCYVDYVRLMDHLDQVAPGLVHHVRYEQLIEHPEQELRAIFAYLGIEWSDEPLNFHKLDRVVRTPSAEQVRRPLNREGVDVWRNYEQWLGPLKDILGPLSEA